ncbi:MFS transporter [Kribbella sp. ALI-6-A]|uniref:MFS transporter n=1 Tax=Kribbella sp. ALI-6-A TaxID=1933817 RepID=UPI00097BB35A|nr:MFS transporter [Kribbella sp. ALI-6-A]ONI79102.1 MFS transporter [Kribbella sp. ALI-6-A]
MSHPRTTTGAPTGPRSMARVAGASLAGTTIEFYDFLIYGLAAGLVFNAIFFPDYGGAEGTWASIATFGVAFVFRPLGAIVFGHFGDRIGRKATLVTTLLIMGLSTFAIGLLPSATSIGVTAVVLLVLLRALQGFALGGEWAGAALLTTEYAGDRKRGAYAMFPQLGPSVGLILAASVMLLFLNTLGAESFTDWAWRLPFLVSLVLVGVGLWVRLKVAETPSFAKVKAQRAEVRLPFGDCIKEQWVQVLLGAGIMSTVFAAFYTGVAFLPGFGIQVLGLTFNQILVALIVAGVVMSVAVIGSAILSDVIGRKRVLMAGMVVALAAGPIAFATMEPGSFGLYVLALCLLLIVLGVSYGPMAAYLPEQFQARYRYTGAGLAYNLAGVLGGALPLVIGDDLIARWGREGIGYFLTANALVSACCLLLLKETKDRPLDVEPSPA